LEQRLGIKRPDELRRFLLAQNGGRPNPAVFDFTASDGKRENSHVQFFLSVYDGKYSNFETKFKTFKVRARRIPDDLIPFIKWK
jgi:hypothetical protein